MTAPMTQVPQRNNYDCGVACAAMLYDMTYEDAESCFPMKCGDPIPGTERSAMQVDCPNCRALAGKGCHQGGIPIKGLHLERHTAADEFGGEPYGINMIDMMWIGLKHGFHVSHIHPKESFLEADWDGAKYSLAPKSDELWKWLEGKRAVMIVPNMTINGNLHFCAWDGRYLIDPLYKRHPARHYHVDDRPRIFDALVVTGTPFEAENND